MQISFKGIETLKELEGFRSKAYKDTGGVWTIGYGTTILNGNPVEPGQCITEAEAQIALRLALAISQTVVNKSVRVTVTQSMFDALVSFVYNVGMTAFKNSTMLVKLNFRDYKGAAKQFDRWVYDNGKIIPGLVSRRKIERALFES